MPNALDVLLTSVSVVAPLVIKSCCSAFANRFCIIPITEVRLGVGTPCTRPLAHTIKVGSQLLARGPGPLGAAMELVSKATCASPPNREPLRTWALIGRGKSNCGFVIWPSTSTVFPWGDTLLTTPTGTPRKVIVLLLAKPEASAKRIWIG